MQAELWPPNPKEFERPAVTVCWILPSAIVSMSETSSTRFSCVSAIFRHCKGSMGGWRQTNSKLNTSATPLHAVCVAQPAPASAAKL